MNFSFCEIMLLDNFFHFYSFPVLINSRCLLFFHIRNSAEKTVCISVFISGSFHDLKSVIWAFEHSVNKMEVLIFIFSWKPTEFLYEASLAWLRRCSHNPQCSNFLHVFKLFDIIAYFTILSCINETILMTLHVQFIVVFKNCT